MASLPRSAIVAVLGIGLVATAIHAWQRAPGHHRFASLDELRWAYGRVSLGMPAAGLSPLGFDRARPGAQTLSYLGTMEFFMPKNSRDYDRLDPAILSCLAAADRCGAYVFSLDGASHKVGLFGFAAQAAAPENRIVFLVRNGRVAYKAMVTR